MVDESEEGYPSPDDKNLPEGGPVSDPDAIDPEAADEGHAMSALTEGQQPLGVIADEDEAAERHDVDDFAEQRDPATAEGGPPAADGANFRDNAAEFSREE
jgi:hypothetical protein